MATNPPGVYRVDGTLQDRLAAVAPPSPPVPMAEFGIRAPEPLNIGVPAPQQQPGSGDPLGRFKAYAAERKATPENVFELADEYWTTQAELRLRSQKGMTEGAVKAHRANFDHLVAQWAQSLQPAEEAPAEEGGYSIGRTLRGLGDLGVQATTATLLGIPQGLAWLGDAGGRTRDTMLGDIAAQFFIGKDAVERRKRSAERRQRVRDALSDFIEDGNWRGVIRAYGEMATGESEGPGWLGRVANALGETREDINRAMVSDQTQQNIQEFGRRATNDGEGLSIEGAVDALAFGLRNPSALTGIGGEIVSMLVPAGLLGLANRGRGAAQAAGAIERALPVAAGGVPVAGRAGGEHVEQVMQMPLDQLLQNPDNARIYQELQAMGLRGPELENATKYRIGMASSVAPVATSMAANVLMPAALGGRGVERMLAGTGTRSSSRVGNALRTGALETGQEGAAEAVENIGGNIAGDIVTGQQTNVTRGSGGAALLGSSLGGPVGATIGFATGGQPAQQRPAPGQKARDTQTDGAQPAGPSPRRARPDVATEAPAPVPPGAGLDTAAEKEALKKARAAGANLLKRKRVADILKGYETPQQVWDEAATRAQEALGEQWAQMSEAQRVSAIDALAGRLNLVAKVDGLDEFAASQRPAAKPAAESAQPASEQPQQQPAEPAPPPTVTAQPLPAELTGDVAAQAAEEVEAEPTGGVDVVAEEAAETPIEAAAEETVVEEAPAEAATETPAEPANGRALIATLTNITSGRRLPKNATSDIVEAYEKLATTGKGVQALKNALRYHTAAQSLGTTAPNEVEIIAAARQEYENRPRRRSLRSTNATQEAAAPETAVAEEPTETPRRSLRKKKADTPQEAPSPNAEAPAPVVEEVGAVEAAEASAPETTISARDIVADDLSDSEIADIEAAIARAQEGDNDASDPTSLTALTSQMVRDEAITREQAQQLRALGREVVRKGERVAADDAAELDAEARAIRDTETVKTRGNPRQDTGGNPTLAGALRSILASDSETKAADLLMAVANDESLPRYERLLARKLAPLATRLGVSLRPSDANPIMSARWPNGKIKYAGMFMRGENAVYINRADAETILHEMLHAITSNLLGMRGRLRRDIPRLAELQNEFEDLLAALRAHIAEVGTASMPADARALFDTEQGPLSNIQELLAYGLTNPSIQDVLANIDAPPNRRKARNLWQWFKNALTDFFGRSPKERSFLDALIESTAELVDYAQANTDVVSQANVQAALLYAQSDPSVNPEDLIDDVAEIQEQFPDSVTNVDATAVTNSQRIGETLLQKAFGLEKSIRAVLAAGGVVNPEARPDDAAVRLDGRKAAIARVDDTEVTQPVLNYIAANVSRWGDTPEQALENLNDFYQSMAGLEVMDILYDMNVKLSGRGEILRAEILDEVTEEGGKMTREERQEAMQRLRAVVDKHAAQSFEDWAKGRYKGEYSPQALEDKLAQLAADFDMTPETMADLNEQLSAVRERTRQRLIEAGKVRSDDPWVDFYGQQWYVPLKYAQDAPAELGLADIDGTDGAMSISVLNKQLQLRKGRRTFAEKPFAQLFVDLRRAADTAATKEFTSDLLDYVTDNEGLLGARIIPVSGDLKSGYTRMDNDKPVRSLRDLLGTREVDGEKVPAGFIHSEGDTHYVVQLPQGSQLLRALSKMNAEKSPNDIARQFGVPWMSIATQGTRILSKLYTTMDPLWQFEVGFLRDLNYIPVTIATSRLFTGPVNAAPFVGRYTWNLGSAWRWLRTAPMQILADYDAQQKYIRDNPKSILAWLDRMRQAGGGTDFVSQFNSDSLGKEILRATKGNDGLRLLTKPIKAYDKITVEWAGFLENIGRVAAFKALVEMGYSDAEAAATVKQAMNYSQSGTHGRLINSFLPFYRVGATAVDVMRKNFVKENGDWDFAKMAKWAPFMGAVGSVLYMTARSLLGDDPEEKDENGAPLASIRKYRPSTLSQRILLPMGEEVGALPIGLGLPQVMLAPGILGTAVAMGDMTPEDAAKEYMAVISRNAPVRPMEAQRGSGVDATIAGILMGHAPGLAQPLIQRMMNIGPFGGPIRTQYPDASKYASEQGMAHTPEEYKAMARELRELSGGAIDMYPEAIKHYAESYGGQPVGMLTRLTLQRWQRERSGEDPGSVGRTATRLASKDDESYLRRRMTTTVQRLEEAVRPTKLEGAKLTPQQRRQVQALRQIKAARTAYNNEIEAIQNNKLWSAEGKRLRRKRADSKLRQAIERAERAIGS